jgi:hypothetical protein
MASIPERALIAFSIVAIPHILVGLYAVWDGGSFGYGLTAPERYAYYTLSGAEEHITVSGAMKYVNDDLCIQSCQACPLYCYRPEDIGVDCSGPCILKTKGGRTLASVGENFTAVLITGTYYENTVFRCYEQDCGFDVKVNENQTFSASIPSPKPTA